VRSAFPFLLHLSTLIGIILVSFLTEFHLPIAREVARPVGYGLVAAGFFFSLWAGLHIGKGIFGLVEPRRETLVTNGPYRIVRHPVYFGQTVALIGIAILMRNWLGLALIILVFIPSELYRASREEKALARRFGEEWEAHAERTPFFLPAFSKSSPHP